MISPRTKVLAIAILASFTIVGSLRYDHKLEKDADKIHHEIYDVEPFNFGRVSESKNQIKYIPQNDTTEEHKEKIEELGLDKSEAEDPGKY